MLHHVIFSISILVSVECYKAGLWYRQNRHENRVCRQKIEYVAREDDEGIWRFSKMFYLHALIQNANAWCFN